MGHGLGWARPLIWLGWSGSLAGLVCHWLSWALLVWAPLGYGLGSDVVAWTIGWAVLERGLGWPGSASALGRAGLGRSVSWAGLVRTVPWAGLGHLLCRPIRRSGPGNEQGSAVVRSWPCAGPGHWLDLYFLVRAMRWVRLDRTYLAWTIDWFAPWAGLDHGRVWAGLCRAIYRAELGRGLGWAGLVWAGQGRA